MFTWDVLEDVLCACMNVHEDVLCIAHGVCMKMCYVHVDVYEEVLCACVCGVSACVAVLEIC